MKGRNGDRRRSLRVRRGVISGEEEGKGASVLTWGSHTSVTVKKKERSAGCWSVG